jgi:hypothetical protein
MSSKSALFPIIGLCVFTVACGSGGGGGTTATPSVKPGTPEYFWAAANQTFKNGEFDKTVANLSKLDASEKFAAKSEPWHIILSAGMAQGYAELAERYDAGYRANHGATPGFTKLKSQNEAGANSSTMEFVEVLHKFLSTNKDPEVILAFTAPAGSTAEPPETGKITKGILPGEAEAAGVQKSMLRRGVLLNTSAAMGDKDDVAKALESFKQGEVKIPRDTFLRSVAQIAYDRAQIYMPKKLDQPKRLGVLYTEALAALDKIPEQTKADKDLSKKIKDDLKKYRLTT